jgi:hypothetical protein
LTIVSEVISDGSNVSKTDVKKILDANLRLLAAQDASAVSHIMDEERDNLPFLVAAGAGLQQFAYLPVEIPSVMNLLEFDAHPKFYPDIKHGVIDELLQMASVGEHWKGKQWFFVKESYVDEKGNTVRLKDSNGELVKIKGSDKTALSKKINEWYRAHNDVQNAIKKQASLDEILKLKKRYMKISADILEVGKYEKVLGEIWDTIRPDVMTDKVGMSVAKLSGQNLCHMWIERNGVTWSMTLKTKISGGKLTFEGISQFYGVVGGSKMERAAYLQAAKIRKPIVGLDNVPVPKVSMMDAMAHEGVVIFTRKVPFVGELQPVVPCKNPNYLMNFAKGAFSFGVLDGLLEGIHTYAKGGTIYDALKSGAAIAVASSALGLGSAWILKKISEYGVQKFALQFATNAFLRGALRLIPIVGWIWTAWEVGKKVGEIAATYQKKEFELYYEKTKAEFDGAYQYYRDTESAYYQDIELKQKNSGSLQIRGVRWKTDDMGGYDSLPRSTRAINDDNSILEFGEEVLLNWELRRFNPNGFTPFVPYLPKYNDYSDAEKENTRRLLAQLAEMNANLIKLRSTLDDNKYWVSDDDEKEIKTIMARIEGAKASIGVYDRALSTKWANCFTPEGGNMYWWCDFRGQSYMMLGRGSRSRPDNESILDFMEEIRNHFQIS